MTRTPSPATSTEPREFSAGGVVVRDGHVAVIVPVRRDARGQRVLGLPKGHLDGEETAEEAAQREVREETGLSADLLAKLGDVEYHYERKGRRVHKRVRFFLFDYVSGDLADHDHEIEDARWLSFDDAIQGLSYAGEREMVRRARSRFPADR